MTKVIWRSFRSEFIFNQIRTLPFANCESNSTYCEKTEKRTKNIAKNCSKPDRRKLFSIYRRNVYISNDEEKERFPIQSSEKTESIFFRGCVSLTVCKAPPFLHNALWFMVQTNIKKRSIFFMLDQPNLSYKETEKQKKEIMRHVDISTLIKNKIKFSSYIRKFRMEQLQSHI
jgi:hypothetical protein